MTRDPKSKLARVCLLLNEENARYLLVGAMAMQLWGTSRSTRDVDILIEPSVDNAERVLRALSALPFRLAAEIDPRELVARPVTMIGDTPNVDVLTRAWNVTWADAERDIAVFEVEGVPIPTLSLAHLIESKRTGRTQDAADIEILEALRTMLGH
ncbi:MAG: hypothetical protein ABIT38_19090 [Gemmatimonadaceae bacterium]